MSILTSVRSAARSALLIGPSVGSQMQLMLYDGPRGAFHYMYFDCKTQCGPGKSLTRSLLQVSVRLGLGDEETSRVLHATPQQLEYEMRVRASGRRHQRPAAESSWPMLFDPYFPSLNRALGRADTTLKVLLLDGVEAVGDDTSRRVLAETLHGRPSSTFPIVLAGCPGPSPPDFLAHPSIPKTVFEE